MQVLSAMRVLELALQLLPYAPPAAAASWLPAAAPALHTVVTALLDESANNDIIKAASCCVLARFITQSQRVATAAGAANGGGASAETAVWLGLLDSLAQDAERASGYARLAQVPLEEVGTHRPSCSAAVAPPVISALPDTVRSSTI